MQQEQKPSKYRTEIRIFLVIVGLVFAYIACSVIVALLTYEPSSTNSKPSSSQPKQNDFRKFKILDSNQYQVCFDRPLNDYRIVVKVIMKDGSSITDDEQYLRDFNSVNSNGLVCYEFNALSYRRRSYEQRKSDDELWRKNVTPKNLARILVNVWEKKYTESEEPILSSVIEYKPDTTHSPSLNNPDPKENRPR